MASTAAAGCVTVSTKSWTRREWRCRNGHLGPNRLLVLLRSRLEAAGMGPRDEGPAAQKQIAFTRQGEPVGYFGMSIGPWLNSNSSWRTIKKGGPPPAAA